VYEGDTLTFPEVKNQCKTFISNPGDTDNRYISLEISREADYQTYLSVINAVQAAYNELYIEQKKSYPIHISEKEWTVGQKGGVR
jgi:hypothetical protein